MDQAEVAPNLLYTDGNTFSVWRDGQLEGKIIQLDGDVQTAGASLSAPTSLRCSQISLEADPTEEC
jgi:hypothetical protein